MQEEMNTIKSMLDKQIEYENQRFEIAEADRDYKTLREIEKEVRMALDEIKKLKKHESK